jgi:YbbR domain-containing protein
MRTLTRIFRHNWPQKVTAVALAVVLWGVVLVETNPWTTRRFEATVEVRNVPEGLQVMSISPPKVTVALAGRRHTVDRVAMESLRAYAGVGDRDVGEHQVAVILEPGELPRGVEVLSPSTYTVTVALDKTDEQTRAVLTEFRGRTAPGYAAIPGRPRPNEVTISGPRSLVQSVSSVVAVIDYSGIQATRDFTSRLEARDARGMPQEGVAISPPTAQIEVAVEALNVKTVPVRVDLSAPRGRTVASIEVSPLVVTLTGKPEALRPIQFIPTRSVRVEGDGVLPAVELQLPPGVSIIGDQPSVRVAVTLQPLKAPRPRSPAPTPGLGPGSAEGNAGGNG